MISIIYLIYSLPYIDHLIKRQLSEEFLEESSDNFDRYDIPVHVENHAETFNSYREDRYLLRDCN